MDVAAGVTGPPEDPPAGPRGCPPDGDRCLGAPAALVLGAQAIGAAAVSGLGADQALAAVLTARAAAAAAFAVHAEALARLAAVYPPTELDGSRYEDAAVVFELMPALGISQRGAANELARAQEAAALPALCAALRAGTLDVPAARLLLDTLRALPAGLRADALDRLLAAHAGMPGGLTRAQLGRLARRIVAQLDPDGAQDRQGDAVRDRRVWHHPATAPGDEATLGMTGPADRVALCADTIDALARAILDHARSTPPEPSHDHGAADGGPGPVAAPVCPPSATLEQARFDALDWLITGRTAQSHPAWASACGEESDRAGADRPAPDQQPAHDEDEVPPWEQPTTPARGGPAATSPAETPTRTAEDAGQTHDAGPDPSTSARTGDRRDAHAGRDDIRVDDHRPGRGRGFGNDPVPAHDTGPAADIGSEAATWAATDDRDDADEAGDAGPEASAAEPAGSDAEGTGDPQSGARAAQGRASDPAGAAGAGVGGGRDAGGCGCGRPQVTVTAHVTLSLATLLGLDEQPGELTGHGPIPAGVARDLAASATTWRRLLTDPVDGHLVTQAIKSYRPTPAMRTFVRARSNGTCAARGCTARVGLQIDHTTPYPHGPTSVTNFGLLHQPHHQGKTCGAWHHEMDPDTGALTQTSPLGHTYITTPLPPLGGSLTGPTADGSDRDTELDREAGPDRDTGLNREARPPNLIAELDHYLHRIDPERIDPDEDDHRSSLERHVARALTGVDTGPPTGPTGPDRRLRCREVGRSTQASPKRSSARSLFVTSSAATLYASESVGKLKTVSTR